jgi:ssDNA-binding Zn-finger/Zn-ribbon topoisomerase 1
VRGFSLFSDLKEDKMELTNKCPKCGKQLTAVRINLMIVGIGCANPDCLFHAVVTDQPPKNMRIE